MNRRKVLFVVGGVLGALFLGRAASVNRRPRLPANSDLARINLESEFNLEYAALLGERIHSTRGVPPPTFVQLYQELIASGVPLHNKRALLDAVANDFGSAPRIIELDGWDLGELEAKLYQLIYLGTSSPD